MVKELLPNSFRHRPNLTKALSNVSWLVSDRIIRALVAFSVGIWVARYLGPSQYGTLSYCLALTALFAGLAPLGLRDIVVRDLVARPDAAGTTMGTTLALQFLGSVASVVMLLIAAAALRPEGDLTRLLTAVLSGTILLRISDVFKYWFEAEVESKFVVWMETSAVLIIALVRVLLILNGAPLIWFVLATVVEAGLIAVGLTAVYLVRARTRLEATFKRARELLVAGFPLLLSSVAILIYTRIDQVMLGRMIDDTAVGIYSVAVRFSEAWLFLPAAIVASAFPTIIRDRSRNPTTYLIRLHKLYAILIAVGIGVAIPVTFTAPWIITTLFGEPYADASFILLVHIWGGVLATLGLARGRWLIMENLQRYSFYYVGIGALLNILLNLWLIPIHGLTGAVVATVVTQVTTVLMIPALIPATRPSVRHILLAVPVSLNLIRIRG